MARHDIMQKDLVRLAGRSEPYWSQRLNGTTGFSLVDVEQLAIGFGVSPEKLLSELWR